MAVVMKQFIDRFANMEKIANETLGATPDALIGVDSLPGSENDKKVPEEAKKPDAEVAQGQPAGATTADGAVNGGDAKPLNEDKLEVDQALLNPEKKPEIAADALTAKEANAKLASIIGDLLDDIKEKPTKQAQCNEGEKKEDKKEEPKKEDDKSDKEASAKQKISLDDETISKIAAAQAIFNAGRQAAEKKLSEKTASARDNAVAIIKAACVKAAQEQGLDPATAEAAADNAMAAAGLGAPAAAAPEAASAGSEGAAAADDGDVQIPEDVTEEELGEAIIDLVQSGELDPDTAKALVDEIAGDDAGVPSEDEAAEIIAQGLESGEITPEQAQEIAAALEGAGGEGDAGAADAAVADAAAAGAADADAAVQDAKDEAAGAAAAEEALKQASAQARNDVLSKVASAIEAKRTAKAQSAVPGSRVLDKVASILEAKSAEKTASAKEDPDAKYIEGFCKRAAELGVDPKELASYALASAKSKTQTK